MEVEGDMKYSLSDIRLQLSHCRKKYSAKCQELLDECVTLGIQIFLNFKTELHGLQPLQCSCSFAKDVKTSKDKKRMFLCCTHKDNMIPNKNTTDDLFLNKRNEMFAAIYEKKDRAITNIVSDETDSELDSSLNNAFDLVNFLDKHFKH